MDLLLGLSCLVSFLLALLVMASGLPLRASDPWRWVGLFGIFHGLEQGVLILAHSFPQHEVWLPLSQPLAALAFISLFEFGRTGSVLAGRKALPQWVLIPLLAGALAFSRGGWLNAHQAVCVAISLPIGIYGGWVFWQLGRKEHLSKRMAAQWAGIGLAVLGISKSMHVVFPETCCFAATQALAGLHEAAGLLLALEALTLTGVAGYLWQQGYASQATRAARGPAKPTSRMQLVLMLSLGASLLVGGVATEVTGRLLNQELRRRLIDTTQTVAASLDISDMAALAANYRDTNGVSYQRLRRQCVGLASVNRSLTYIYVMGRQQKEIVFYLDTEPERPAGSRQTSDKPPAKPGDVYDDAPPGLQAVFDKGEPQVVGPYTDKWGTYVSGYVAERDPKSGRILSVVGFDVDASTWEMEIARARMIPILTTVVIAMLLSLFILVRERDEIAKDRLLDVLSEKQTVLDAASEVGIVATNPNGVIKVFNRGAEKMLGHVAGELVDHERFLAFLLPEEIAERRRELKSEMAQAGDDFSAVVEVARGKGADQREWTLVRKNGSRLPVSLAVTAAHGPGGFLTGFLFVAVDLTARKRAEREVLEKERFISAVAQASPDFLVVFSCEHLRPIYSNRRLADTLGFSGIRAGQLEQDPIGQLVHPDDLGSVRNHYEQIKQAADGVVRTIDCRMQAGNGEFRWFQARTTIFRRSPEGNVIQVLSVIQDISDIRKAEAGRVRLEAQLRQSQKLEAVGQLAAGVAHDFNNLLTVIQGNAALVQETNGHEAIPFCSQILEASQRAASLTRQLLLFSRQHQPQRRPVNLGEVVPRLAEMLARLIGEHIEFHWHCQAPLPLVLADRSMIEQVVVNLAVNARDAMPEGGKLTLQVEALELDAAAAERHPKATTGRFVCLSVADTGCGIEAQILPRIFDPFFTTKEVGKGTGLGLATVYGIMEQHQGWVEVNSAPAQGSVFKIYLPAAEGETAMPGQHPAQPASCGDGETVLLVEDETAVRALAERVLRRGGYQVVCASTGAEALRLWPTHRDQVKLLITDQLMPEGISGHQLAVRLRAEKPDLKVLLTSGYCADVTDIMPGDDSFDFIAKPYTPASLLQTVQETLKGEK